METKRKVKIKIKEQEELLELIKCNLQDTEIVIRGKSRNTQYSEELIDFYLDQYSETTRKLEKLKNELELLKKEYQLFSVMWKIKNKYYEKRNKRRSR